MLKIIIITLFTAFSMLSAYATEADVEAGYRYENYQTNKVLNEENIINKFNETYNFQSLAIEGQLPPVLKCHDNYGEVDIATYEKDMETMKKSFILPSNPLVCLVKTKFVPLSTDSQRNKTIWKSYFNLPTGEQTPSMDIEYMKNNEDFQKGRKKGQDLFSSQMKILDESYKGMSNYKLLSDQGMVTQFVKESN